MSTRKKAGNIKTVPSLHLRTGWFPHGRARSLGTACLPLILALAAAAQQKPAHEPPQGSSADTFVLRQNVKEVLLYCTVLDRKGTLVTDLDQSAFTVTENKKPVAVVNFSRKDVPVSVDLLLDSSASMKDKQESVQAAAVTLIQESKPEDETAVTNFADALYLDQDFTGNSQELGRALAQSRSVSGGTALFDTLISAADHLAKAANYRKQVIVVITDGRDNASAVDLQAAIRRVQTVNGPVVYSIGLLYDVPAMDARRARHDLQVLSDGTGGTAFFPHSAGEVAAVAAEVARDIRHQYTVSYRPPENAPVGSYRTIAVQASAKDRGKLSVRTRKGYVRVATTETDDKAAASNGIQP